MVAGAHLQLGAPISHRIRCQDDGVLLYLSQHGIAGGGAAGGSAGGCGGSDGGGAEFEPPPHEQQRLCGVAVIHRYWVQSAGTPTK